MSGEGLWEAPTVEEAFATFYELDKKATEAIAAAKTAVQEAETAHRTLTGQVAHLVRISIMQRDNARAERDRLKKEPA